MSAYSTSKAGVIGLAKAAGKEYAETGITINALAPAVIRTGGLDSGSNRKKFGRGVIDVTPFVLQPWWRACSLSRSST